jgi:hypothetical protein
MEAVAAAASIVGILGVAGQALSGLLKLRSLIGAIKDAPTAAKQAKEDIDSLQQTLESVIALANLISETDSEHPLVASALARLETTICRCKERCDQELEWLDKKVLLTKETKGPFRRFIGTVKGITRAGLSDEMKKLSARMLSLRPALHTELSLLGRQVTPAPDLSPQS